MRQNYIYTPMFHVEQNQPGKDQWAPGTWISIWRINRRSLVFHVEHLSLECFIAGEISIFCNFLRGLFKTYAQLIE